MAVQLTVDPNQDLDSLLATLKAQSSKDVVLVLPQETRALQTLDNFYALRKEVRDANINLSFVGGNKTVKGLAKLLGFNTLDTAPVGGDEPAPSFGAPASGRNGGMGGSTAPYGLGDGFVVQQPGANGGNPPGTFDFNSFDSPPSAPPPTRSSRDIFNEMSSFDPGIPNQPIKPPPVRGGNGGGDTPLTRENIPDFFDSADGGGGFSGGGRTSSPPPRAAMDFGSGDNTGNKTMSFEEAMRSGIFPGGQGQLTNSPLDSIDNDDDFGDPSIPDADDNAASDFRSGGGTGVRTSIGNRPEKGRKARNAKPSKKPARSNAKPAGGIVAAINKIINPVEPRKSGEAMMIKPELDPEEKARRDRQRRSTTLITLLSVVGVVVLLLAIIILFVIPKGPDNQGPGIVTLVVPVKPQPISSTIQIQLQTVPSGTTGQPTTPGAAGTASATTAAATTAASGVTTATAAASLATLPVEIVNTGELKKSGEVAASGARKVPEKAAEGPVTIQNASFGARTFAAGTVVATRNGVTYRLKSAVTVGGIGGDGRVGSAGGTVVADKAGPVGNSDSFTIVAGNARFFVGKVEGGTERDEKVVQQADYDNLQKQLTEQVRSEASNNVRYNQQVQSFLPIRQTDVKCDFNKKVGDGVDDSAGKLTGSCQMSIEGIIYNKTAAAQVVEANLIKDKTRYQLPENPVINLSQPKLIEVNGQRVIQVEASGTVLPKLDETALKAALAGKPKTEVAAIVQSQFPAIDAAAIGKTLDTISDASLPDINRLVISTVSSESLSPAGTVTAAPGGTVAMPVGSPTALPQGGNSQPAPVPTATVKK